MRYFGKKSVSSYLALFFRLSWYIGLTSVGLLVIFSILSLAGITVLPGWQKFNVIDFPGVRLYLDTAIIAPFFWQLLMLIALCAYLMIFFQLKLIFHELANENTFHPTNVKRVQVIGVSVIIGGFFHSWSSVYTGKLLSDTVSISGGQLGVLINPLPQNHILFGIIILVIAEILRGAVLLKEENNLTI